MPGVPHGGDEPVVFRAAEGSQEGGVVDLDGGVDRGEDLDEPRVVAPAEVGDAQEVEVTVAEFQDGDDGVVGRSPVARPLAEREEQVRGLPVPRLEGAGQEPEADPHRDEGRGEEEREPG